MNIEQMLEAELHVVADELDVPRPPIAELVREGRKASRNRTRVYVAGLAAASVAVVATGLAVADLDPRADDGGPSTTRPSPTAPSTGIINESLGLPTGDVPSMPYIVNEKLYVPDRQVPGQWEYLPETQIGGGTLVSWSSERGWLLVRNGTAEELQVDRGAPKLSPNGRFLVHFVGSDMILRDLVEGREIGRRSIAEEVNVDGEYTAVPRGVDNAGRVFYGSGRVFMWDGTGDPVPVSRPTGPPPIAGDIYQVLADRIVILDSPDGTVLQLASVAEDGRVTFESAVPGEGPRVVSLDGSWVAWQTKPNGEVTGNLEDPDEDAVTVQHLGTNVRFTMPMNDGSFIRDIRWESDQAVLINMGERIVRCDVVEGACEYAVAP